MGVDSGVYILEEERQNKHGEALSDSLPNSFVVGVTYARCRIGECCWLGVNRGVPK